MNEKPGLLIIEDHPIMREGIASYFEQTERWQVSGKAANLEEAKEIFLREKIDVALIDIQLDEDWGIDIIPWLKETNRTPVLAVYSAYNDYAHVSAALEMGVQVYICKRRYGKELEDALFDALNGKTVIDDLVQTKLKTVADLCSILTKREGEILTMVKSGLTNREIAAKLNLSLRTIENILSCVYDKTGVNSREKLQKL